MAKKKPKPNSPLLGRWLIVSMSNWDEDYLNEEVPAFIKFESRQRGEFHFGYVRGGIDYRDVLGDGRPPSNSPGTGTTRWTRPRAGAGLSWMTTGSRG